MNPDQDLPFGNDIITLQELKQMDISLDDSNPMLYSLYLHANKQHLTELQKQYLHEMIEQLKINFYKINSLNLKYMERNAVIENEDLPRQ
jgi:hypothetical protein